MNFLEFLIHSYTTQVNFSENPPCSRVEYLVEYIFNFTTYDAELAAFFGRKAVEVAAAINNRTTFDYIKDADNYKWYLVMCNMPFFADRIDWGTSIRGAFWRTDMPPLDVLGLWNGGEQITVPFYSVPWSEFVAAMVTFAQGDAP